MSDQNNNNKEIPSTSNLNAKGDQYTKEIGKQKRDEIINTNRDRIRENDNIMQAEEVDPENAQEEENETLDKLIEQWKNQTFSQTDFEDLVSATNSEDRLRQFYGFVGLTKLGENLGNRETTVQSIIDRNIPTVIKKVLSMPNEPYLHREAAALVQLITYGNDHQREVLLYRGVLPHLFQLLKSESKKTLEYLFITIKNITCNSQHRDTILTTLGLNPLLEAINKVTSPELIKIGAGALSNLCRGKHINLVEQAIPTLSAIFKSEEDVDVLHDTVWALVHLSESRSRKIMETNIIPKLIQHMDHQSDQISLPCLKIIGNFWALLGAQNDVRAYGSEFVLKLLKVLHNPRSSIRREAFRVISNITAGTSSHVTLIFDHAYFTDVIIRIVKTDIPEIVRDAIMALVNAMKNLDENKVSEVIEWGVLDCLIYVLDDPDPIIVRVALEGIFTMLELGQVVTVENDIENEALELLENKGGAKKIGDLQNHENYDFCKLASDIIATFFELK